MPRLRKRFGRWPRPATSAVHSGTARGSGVRLRHSRVCATFAGADRTNHRSRACRRKRRQGQRRSYRQAPTVRPAACRTNRFTRTGCSQERGIRDWLVGAENGARRCEGGDDRDQPRSTKKRAAIPKDRRSKKVAPGTHSFRYRCSLPGLAGFTVFASPGTIKRTAGGCSLAGL
jgi:hypothetical protein